MPATVALKSARSPRPTGVLTRAAAYVRASTEDQQYSTENQFDAICAYAAQHGLVIVRKYVDEGKSGLTIKRRRALKQLIEDVVAGSADYSIVLVYDVSRWGRFQDADEGAYYEYICRRAGVKVHFCAEQFDNDDNVYSVIVKSLKRAMAGEYSRELSVKVFAAHARFVKLGYAQGGAPGYGLRRLLLDRHGSLRGELRSGERKSIATDRIVLVPGPPEEVETVRWIFESFVMDRKRFGKIASVLNQRKVPAANAGVWTGRFVKSILCCERYVGNNVWNRASTKLNSKVVRNAPENWIRADGCIEPIVAKSLFLEAQEIMRQRSRKLSQAEKLEPLRRLLREHDFLTTTIIASSPGVPTVASYQRWFGGLKAAYQLLGYEQRRPCRRMARRGRGPSDEMLLELLRPLLREHGYISHKIIANADGVPSVATYCKRFGGMKNLCGLLAKFPEHPNNQPYDNRYSRINAVTYNLSDENLLDRVRDLLRVHGALSSKIIDATRGLPCRDTYRRHFGSMARVYQLIGYHPR